MVFAMCTETDHCALERSFQLTQEIVSNIKICTVFRNVLNTKRYSLNFRKLPTDRISSRCECWGMGYVIGKLWFLIDWCTLCEGGKANFQSFRIIFSLPCSIWFTHSLICGRNKQVEPGEIIEITKYGVKTVDIVERPEDRKQSFCIFEYVYFARSDSIFEGQMVYSVRLQCGRQLARESLVSADVVSSGEPFFSLSFSLEYSSLLKFKSKISYRFYSSGVWNSRRSRIRSRIGTSFCWSFMQKSICWTDIYSAIKSSAKARCCQKVWCIVWKCSWQTVDFNWRFDCAW